MPLVAQVLLERETLGRRVAEAELELGRRIEPAVGEIAACLGRRARDAERRLEEFRRQLDDIGKRPAPLLARLVLVRHLRQRDAGLRRQPLDRLGEREPLGRHHEVEDVAVLAGGEVEPRHLLVVDEERRRLLLVEGRKPLPLAPGLLELHAPADHLRNRQACAQLVEELGRKAHGCDPNRFGHDSGQIGALSGSRGRRGINFPKASFSQLSTAYPRRGQSISSPTAFGTNEPNG